MPLPAKKKPSQGATKNKNKKIAVATKRGEDDLTIKGLVKNLFSVCAHIQNPDLYTPIWADQVVLQKNDGAPPQQQPMKLVTANPVQKGDILTLYPLDALGLRTQSSSSTTTTRKPLKIMPERPPASPKVKDFVVFDQDKDGSYFQSQLSESLTKSQPLGYLDYRVTVPLRVLHDNSQQHEQTHELFVDINPIRRQPSKAGWMGHLATKQQQQSPDGKVNCKVIPLPGAAPLCALVATSDMDQGTELIAEAPLLVEAGLDEFDYATMIQRKYKNELQELGTYLQMAYQATPLQPFYNQPPSSTNDKDSEEADVVPPYTEESADTPKAASDFKFPFHTINLDYPGLRYLHRNPDIIAIDNFLTEEECDKITTNAQSHLIPCVIKHPTTGVVQEDPSRTSTNANLPQSDVPSIVDKFVHLSHCPDATYLETLQILKYTKGQFFYPHTDGFQGPTTACGFEQSGRLVTIFCYLNNVPEGGETRFPQLRIPNDSGSDEVLSIAPRKGMAVVHFPETTGFEEDDRTEHEGSAAIDDKWLLVTWAWKDPRTDPQYAEHLFPSIMGDAAAPSE